jgi:hypothetical protein
MPGFVAIMWAIWGVLVATMLALKIYTGKLSQNEDDHLILDDAFDQMKNEQATIVAKVNKVKPLENASIWLSLAATVFVAGYYVMDFARQFK